METRRKAAPISIEEQLQPATVLVRTGSSADLMSRVAPRSIAAKSCCPHALAEWLCIPNENSTCKMLKLVVTLLPSITSGWQLNFTDAGMNNSKLQIPPQSMSMYTGMSRTAVCLTAIMNQLYSLELLLGDVRDWTAGFLTTNCSSSLIPSLPDEDSTLILASYFPTGSSVSTYSC